MKRRPRLPDHVQVGPYRYAVVCDVESHAAVTGKDDETLMGWTAHGRQTISLEPSLAHDMMAGTLLHEVLHAVWYIGNVNAAQQGVEDPEEAAMGSLDGPLLGVLRSNPALVKFLTWTPDA